MNQRKPDPPPAPSPNRHVTVNGCDIAFEDRVELYAESDEESAKAKAAEIREKRNGCRVVLPIGEWEVVATYAFVSVVARKREAGDGDD
jgi:hypothetical protein